MRSPFLILVTLLIAVCSTGCFDIIEKLTLKEDGSGEVNYEFDMSEMLNSMMTMFDEEGSNEEREPSNGVAWEKYDTTMYFADMMDSIDIEEKFKEIVSKLTMTLSMDEENMSMVMKMKMPFDKIEQINELQEAFSAMQEESDFEMPMGLGGGMGMMGEGASGPQFAFDGKKFTRFEIPQIPMEEGPETEMMLEMMEGGSYTYEYTLPFTMKKAPKGYKLSKDKRGITRTFDLVEIMKGGEKTGFEISGK